VRSVLAALVLASSAQAVPARAADSFVFFRTPSHNIGCVESSTLGGYLRCDILSGLKPRPPKPSGCTLDWGFGYTLDTRGRAHVTCAGDTAVSPDARVLPYGTTWHRGAFRCSSRTIGLRCRNRSGHGFFLSRERSYRF
jgi:hypothetical protein